MQEWKKKMEEEKMERDRSRGMEGRKSARKEGKYLLKEEK